MIRFLGLRIWTFGDVARAVYDALVSKASTSGLYIYQGPNKAKEHEANVTGMLMGICPPMGGDQIIKDETLIYKLIGSDNLDGIGSLNDRLQTYGEGRMQPITPQEYRNLTFLSLMNRCLEAKGKLAQLQQTAEPVQSYVDVGTNDPGRWEQMQKDADEHRGLTGWQR